MITTGAEELTEKTLQASTTMIGERAPYLLEGHLNVLNGLVVVVQVDQSYALP